MHVIGIIAEYNPFHRGHAYQIQRVHEIYPDAAVVAVMSGSFTQRGEAAIFDKWTRAQLAVLGGCDLVIELPFVFACRSAQDFACGGVTLLHRLGIVDTLAFGAESNDLNTLQTLAWQMDDDNTQKRLQAKIKSGMSYATALTETLASNAELLHQPNNILAIEYLRSLHLLQSSMQPLLIPRCGAAYHDTNLRAPNASASAIRQALYQHEERSALADALPMPVFAELAKLNLSNLPDMNQLFFFLRYELLQMPVENLQALYGINEGIENRIIAAARQANDYKSFIRAVTTKRYPSSRIRRTLLYLLLQLAQSEVQAFSAAGPLYARVLAVSARGRSLLSASKHHASLPLITKVGTFVKQKDQRCHRQDLSLLAQMLRYDTLATDLRNLSLPQCGKNDWQMSPVFLS